MLKGYRLELSTVFLLTFLLLNLQITLAEEDPCLICHRQFKRPAKAVHTALAMGCETCHMKIEDKRHPQQKGSMKLMQDTPGLCYGCHDDSKFKERIVHSPVAGGMCTGCHNPHQSEFGKILISDQPDLCYSCHDSKDFTKKNVHAAVYGGCTSCHSPHASENNALLLKPTINGLCLECHPQIAKDMHIMISPRGGSRGHPMEGSVDPVRKGRRFSCISCHEPHSSDWVKLLRYKADSGYGVCMHCHKV